MVSYTESVDFKCIISFKKEAGMKKKIYIAALVSVMMILTLVSCSGMNSKALHINYGEKDNYGTGDYLYTALTVSGSGMSREKVYSVRELEELAEEDRSLSYEGTYSMLTRGAIFSKHTMTGVRLYELLADAGLEEKAVDDTDVKVVSADGYVTVLSLGEIRNSTDNTYDSIDSEKPESEKVPVILAFGSDGYPLTGPVGSRLPGEDVPEKEGFVKSAENVGGPVRLIAGQKSADEYNAPDNAKWVRKIIVGNDDHAGMHSGSEAERSVLKAVVKNKTGKVLDKKEFSYKDIETFSETEENYYGENNYYKGVDLWSFLAASLDFASREGSVKLTYDDGTSDEIDIAYFRNLKGDYSGYINEKDGLKITNVKPALGYSVNGSPSDKGVYALLPQADGYLDSTVARPVSRIELDLTGDDELSENPYGGYKIKFTGSGLKKETTLTVNELEQYTDLRVTDGDRMGISLAGVLEDLGLSVDADKATVTGVQEKTYTLSQLEKNRDKLILITRENGRTPEKGGPVKTDSVECITEIKVGVKKGQWTHDKAPFDKYSKTILKVSGSGVKKTREYTLAELEKKQSVKDSFGASNGISGYQGVILRALVKENLKDGIDKPGSITVTGKDGYSTTLDVNDVMNGIESKYQQGEKRDVIIAYSVNGAPRVADEKADGFNGENGFGPMRLVVENQVSKWVKSVKEIRIGE